jgi:hypothetical protein
MRQSRDRIHHSRYRGRSDQYRRSERLNERERPGVGRTSATPTKMILRIIGAIMIILGLVVVIIGASQQQAKSMGDEGWFEAQSAGSFTLFGGVALMIFGFLLLYLGFIRRVSTYYARELSPAMEIGSKAVGTGITRGIQRSGGIKLDIHSNGTNTHATGAKEVIRIKCRNCGYLDTEDAEFCSKCGKRI